MVRERLRSDFQLALVTFFGACVVVAVTPFAVYRVWRGEVVAGFLDAVIVIGTLAAVAYAWVTGRTRAPANLLAVMYSVGVIVLAFMLGPPVLFWVFPVMLGTFLLVGRRVAAGLSIGVIGTLVIFGDTLFADALTRMAFLAGATVLCALAMIFAYRTKARHDQLEVLATHDPLTGVGNRRALERELDLTVEAFRRYGESAGALAIDLDHFKLVNDRHGHEFGDQVLVKFTEIVEQSTRMHDRLFRLGGEEFLLLVPGGRPDLGRIAEKLRQRVQEELHCPDGPVTISIGAAMLRPDEDWPAWLRRADAALYRAKAAGRNQVHTDDEESPTAPEGAPGVRPAQ